jgi:hypothetical protein
MTRPMRIFRKASALYGSGKNGGDFPYSEDGGICE